MISDIKNSNLSYQKIIFVIRKYLKNTKMEPQNMADLWPTRTYHPLNIRILWVYRGIVIRISLETRGRRVRICRYSWYRIFRDWRTRNKTRERFWTDVDLSLRCNIVIYRIPKPMFVWPYRCCRVRVPPYWDFPTETWLQNQTPPPQGSTS